MKYLATEHGQQPWLGQVLQNMWKCQTRLFCQNLVTYFALNDFTWSVPFKRCFIDQLIKFKTVTRCGLKPGINQSKSLGVWNISAFAGSKSQTWNRSATMPGPGLTEHVKMLNMTLLPKSCYFFQNISLQNMVGQQPWLGRVLQNMWKCWTRNLFCIEQVDFIYSIQQEICIFTIFI